MRRGDCYSGPSEGALRRRVAGILLLFPWLAVPPLAEGPPPAGPPPVVNLERLERVKSGWAVAEATGDTAKGTLTVERAVWPMFYLHWMSRAGAGDVTAQEAEAVVGSLWPELNPDAPLKARPIELPSHHGMIIETTRSHGEMRSRYLVWACRESGRLFVADINVSLIASAPEALSDLQRDMARTVRCHPDARVDTFGSLPILYEIPEANVSYHHAEDWVPVANYKPVQHFGDPQWTKEAPRNTPEKGQSLVLEADSMKRLFVSWGPAADFPMSHDVVKTRVEDHWRERSKDLFVMKGNVVNDFWYVDGVVRMGSFARQVPPTRMHKFRAWMWRREGMTWFAVADIGGINFGRANIALQTETWNLMLEEMFQAINQ